MLFTCGIAAIVPYDVVHGVLYGPCGRAPTVGAGALTDGGSAAVLGVTRVGGGREVRTAQR